MIYRPVILCILLVFSTSFHTIKLETLVENTSVGCYLSKTIKLKKITFQSCAKYKTENYIILVDKKTLLDNLKLDISDSTYFRSLLTSNDTLDINKMNLKERRHLQDLLIKQIEKRKVIVIHTESGESIYKIKRRKYNRKTGRTRRGGIEYIDTKRNSVIFDIGLWIS